VPHGGLNVGRQRALGATERRHYGDGGDLPARNMVNMRDLNLASVDLNLLPALEALLRRHHVTRAAEDVGLSQPAMSHVLARPR
jgi:hypothetical protein